MFKPKALTVPFVFNKLTEIAKVSGKDVRLPCFFFYLPSHAYQTLPC
jgi:hypothetical protein